MTGADICRKAMQAGMLLGAGAQIPGTDVQDVMDVVNMVIDGWNADRKMVYCERQTPYTITPNLNPHTIGPTGTWVQSQRPESLSNASVIDTSVTPNVYIPIHLRDFHWQAQQAVPGVTGTISISGYYEPDWPNGRLYLYPVPTLAYGVNLWQRVILAQMALTDTFSLPPGYLEALVLTSAEYLCPMWDSNPPALLSQKAAEARVRLWSENIIIPRISTRDAGMPSGNSRRNTFFWPDGTFTSGNRG